MSYAQRNMTRDFPLERMLEGGFVAYQEEKEGQE
jgi:hypothetical protein